ncbi:cyclin-dependent kinase 1-A-like [Pistacia vera]|uniref:cyclin-dependent kinase 1-A-like n=1 Tax=Pistacia vera TaxID=55513 RepID=UPI001263227D|nr:cyclin-dependent kinase 1-A-like [Pistacia vera]
MSSRHKRFPSDAMNKKYTVDKTIRDGKYGLIGNGVERDTGQLVAFKFIEKSNELGELPNLESPSLITHETSKNIGLNHPNATRCLRIEIDDTFLYLVFENLPWDLDDFRRGWLIAIDFDQISFNCSIFFKGFFMAVALKAASLYYQAPEKLFNGSSKVVDTWAVGCIFGEMLTGRPLFRSNNWVLGEPKPEVYGKIEITIDGLGKRVSKSRTY